MTPPTRHALFVLAALLIPGAMTAQTSPGKVEFEVASVKPSASNNLPAKSAFPLVPGSVYVANGGHFSAVNFPLATYIAFAYDVVGADQEALLSQLPGWATTDRYDIEART